MAISNRTVALLAAPFQGGGGPSHGQLDLIWTSADAADYLPDEGNKLERVLQGLRNLRDGGAAGTRPLLPDHARLRVVVGDLATRLMVHGQVNADELDASLANDGLAVVEGQVAAVRPVDEPADRLAEYVAEVFGDRDDLSVARRHFEQANRAFNRGDWEAANAQFRSAFDATYDALAAACGSTADRRGGTARAWLQAQERLEADEGDLLRAFATFAGRAGSHAGLSDATDSQLRRHFATALIAFGIAKLG